MKQTQQIKGRMNKRKSREAQTCSSMKRVSRLAFEMAALLMISCAASISAWSFVFSAHNN
jgi:hypothetical protein